MQLTYPYLFYGTLALGLPLLIGLGLWAGWQRQRDLKAFGDLELVNRLTGNLSNPKRRVRFLMILTGIFLSSLALSGPQYGTKMVEVKRQGVDVIVALDVSRSMLAEDVQPNRLKRAQQELTALVDSLNGDRVGVVAFAGSAQIACPLTTDYAAVKMFLNYLTPDTIVRSGTNLSTAIRAAIQTFPEGSEGFRVLVLLTDGEDHDSDVLEAAREAKAVGIRILGIGFGNPAGEPIPIRDAGGTIRNYVKDDKGQTVVSKLDEATLKEITALTAGAYLTAYQGSIEAEKIAAIIGKMQKREISGGQFGAFENRFQFVLLPALLFLIVAYWLPQRRGAWLFFILMMLFFGQSAWAGPAAEDNNQGNRKYHKGDYEAALEAYRDAQIKNPDEPVVEYNLGNVLNRLERHEDAENSYQRALKSRDKKVRAKTLYNLGNNFFSQQKYKEAVEHYKAALKLKPRDEDTIYNLSQAMAFLKNPPPRQKKQKSQDEDKEKAEQKKDGQARPSQADPEKQGQQDKQHPGDDKEKSEDAKLDKKGEAKPDNEKADATPQKDVRDAPKPGEMSRQEAENLLNAVREAEKEAQKERMKQLKRQPATKGRQDW
ncbi:VWA domain-containing protein [bacterium]|nr:VWA domain-containing protein [bacterium]